MTQEELLQKIEELIKASAEGQSAEMRAIIREEIKVGNVRVVEEITEVITSVIGAASEKDQELEKRIDRLEEHTGLTKHN